MSMILIAASLAAASPEVDCLATAIHHEARGESTKGKEAVAQVIMNRVKDKRFPNTVCGVVYQKGQFSNIKRAKKPGFDAISVARRAISGQIANIIGKRLYFNGIGPKKALRIGNHKFW